MDRNRDSITSFIFCLFSFIFLLRWTTIKHFPLSCLVVIMRVTCKLLSILSYHRRNKILGIKFHIKCVSLHHFIFRVQSERLGFLKENKSTRKEPVTLTREREGMNFSGAYLFWNFKYEVLPGTKSVRLVWCHRSSYIFIKSEWEKHAGKMVSDIMERLKMINPKSFILLCNYINILEWGVLTVAQEIMWGT